MLNNDYILRIAESKTKYHRDKSKMNYEEKFNIIISLQRLALEIKNNNPSKSKNKLNHQIWQLNDF
jgi:hypothetical protein